uniref:Phosphoglycerate mutase n=1 Tax=Panagrolaimus sp. PS1159 TaxID=55785 RepID=A0AC35G6B5_9BILA
MARNIYIIRHAERMDNVDKHWRKKVGDKYTSDNCPLSLQGHKQCIELAKWFEEIKVNHVFASPLDRTLDTATRMIGNRKLQIKPEAGFLENAAYLCSPPGIRDKEILKETYPLIDETYNPVINPWKEEFKNCYIDYDATAQIKETIETILKKYEGDIAIISHGSPIADLLEVLIGKWLYVGQATVSKLIEKEIGKFEALFIADHAHLSDKSNLNSW